MSEVAPTQSQQKPPETVLLEGFLSHLEFERRLSQYTVRNYRQALEVFFGWLRKSASWEGDLDAITRRDARDFLVERQRAVSRRTLRNQVSGIRAFFKHCLRQGHAKANPFLSISLPKLPKTLPKFLTKSQMETLLAQPDRLLEGEGA
ncbi:MAG: site-specific integrase, partial [Opitutales bacterium]